MLSNSLIPLFFRIFATTLLVLIAAGCSSSLPETAQLVTHSKQAIHLDDTLQPGPELSPEDVVKIQVEALQNNDSDDTGIEIAFRFASPANRQATGPLHRFTYLVKNPTYRPMLNHKLAEYSPIEISGDTARQRVTITGSDGSANVYLFDLSRQDTPACSGCWLTDGVSFVPTRQGNLNHI
ncbi:MAG: DUF4864 domain-containing protein [Anaerolineaceae bacterium]|nr:DUF4864 domain-containing protein [Anaerolineaceae bacterium]MCB9099079.1 DUF4864 domain-containing protein [Anaerolineales bacterium]